MNKFFTTLLTLAALGIAVPFGLAEGCVPTTSAAEVDTGNLGDPDGDGLDNHYYVDNDLCQPDDCIFSIWIYQESNGISGLQRGDGFKDDTCGNMIDPDTVIL